MTSTSHYDNKDKSCGLRDMNNSLEKGKRKLVKVSKDKKGDKKIIDKGKCMISSTTKENIYDGTKGKIKKQKKDTKVKARKH